MNISNVAKSLACVAALATASLNVQAQSITLDYSTITPPATFSQVLQKNVGMFSDTLKFTINTPTFSAGSVSNLAITIPNFGNIFNITGLSAQLWSDAAVDTLIYDLDTNPLSTADLKTGSGVFQPGSYFFKVSGTANGSFGGQYVFAVTTLPVPEPESYAMLLAGLGVMGAIAARRNKRKTG